MVEIKLNNQLSGSEAEIKSPANGDAQNAGQPGKVNPLAPSDDREQEICVANDICEQLDVELISELRDLVRTEVEANSEKYSHQHYEEIMNEQSPYTCWRYLVHNELRVKDAFELVKSSLAWRKENAIDELRNEDLVKEFWNMSPIVLTGQDKEGAAVVYVLGRNYRKPDEAFKQAVRKFVLNLIFGFDKKHIHDMKQLCMVFDVTDTGFRNIDLDYMTWFIGIRDFIPARIARIYVIGIPFIVRPLIRLIISWLPENFSRIVQCGTSDQLIKPNIEPDNLPLEGGGTRDESYRLAPIEAPWASESAEFAQPAMQKYIEATIGFCHSAEAKARWRDAQLEFERKKSLSSG